MMIQSKSKDWSELPVAIIGGGFSGTLLAINIVRQGAGLP
jgi:cation diffusion facilitator CzcD-associated flavoprotein CzcO